LITRSDKTTFGKGTSNLYITSFLGATIFWVESFLRSQKGGINEIHPKDFGLLKWKLEFSIIKVVKGGDLS